VPPAVAVVEHFAELPELRGAVQGRRGSQWSLVSSRRLRSLWSAVLSAPATRRTAVHCRSEDDSTKGER
jgi:hypothetical protein